LYYSDIVNALVDKEDLSSNENLYNFTLVTGFAPFTGLLLACFISYFISLKKKWLWINSLTIFVIVFPLFRLNLLGWDYAKQVFLYPGSFFSNIEIQIIVNGAILLIIAGILFFLSSIIHFIDKQK
jgi:hypothetical protein